MAARIKKLEAYGRFRTLLNSRSFRNGNVDIISETMEIKKKKNKPSGPTTKVLYPAKLETLDERKLQSMIWGSLGAPWSALEDPTREEEGGTLGRTQKPWLAGASVNFI